MKYRAPHRRMQLPRRLYVVAAIVLVCIIIATVAVRQVYQQNLRPVSTSQQTQIVTIPTGSSVKQISQQLHEQGLIRTAWAFDWYVHSKELGNKLQAGTYAFAPSQSVESIVGTLTEGTVTTRLVTIVPGRRIDQVRADLINDGFAPAAVDAALQPDQYRDVPVMTYVPAGTKTLEGLLYPDSYQRTESTDPTSIIRESLVAMGNYLTPSVQAAFAKQGLTVYQALTLASIVEEEVSKQSDREQVAQVFLKRLRDNMSLGSDVTAIYGAVQAGKNPSVTFDSPYSTRRQTGLPPGPISVVSESAMKAVANPAATDWVYFVAGDDGGTYFARTLDEHNANIDKHCTTLCGR